MDYSNVISVGASMLIIIIIGFVLTKFKIIPKSESDPINSFVFRVGFLPLTLRMLAGKDAHDFNFFPLAIGALHSLGLYAVSLFLFAWPKLHDKLGFYLSTVFPAGYLNYIISGLPIFDSLWLPEEEVMIPMITLSNDLVTSPIFLFMSGIYEIANDNKKLKENGKPPRKMTCSLILNVFSRCLKNPILLGNLFGLLYASTALPVPKFLGQILKLLGDTCLPLALFCIGAFLAEHSIISCPIPQFLLCMVLRIFIGPFFGCVFSYVLKLPPRLARQCVIMTAQPSAVSCYTLADAAHIGAGASSTMVFWSTLFTVPALIIWLTIMDKLHLFVE